MYLALNTLQIQQTPLCNLLHSSCNFPFKTVKFIDKLNYRSEMGGSMLASEMIVNHQEKAYALLQADAEKILKLIKVQMDNLTMPQCPLYEEVLDTQMFGLSREIDFAVRLGLIDSKDGKAILDTLEKELSALHDASLRK
jgi:uncharacterized protein YlaN (UPF0358 family)